MAINKNLVVLGIGGVAVVGMLVWKNKKSTCSQTEKCAEACASTEGAETVVSITEEEYNQILSPEVIAAFQMIAEAAEISNDDAIEKTISNQGAIDTFTHAIAELTKSKIQGIDSTEDVQKIELEVFSQVCDKVKSEIGSSPKKDEFFTAYFHGLKEKTLIEEKA